MPAATEQAGAPAAARAPASGATAAAVVAKPSTTTKTNAVDGQPTAAGVDEGLLSRVVFVDQLMPCVTEQIVSSALSQFGAVRKVVMCRDPLEPDALLVRSCGACALVEMGSARDAETVVEELTEKLFVIGFGPRPARACHATMEMLDSSDWPRARRKRKLVLFSALTGPPPNVKVTSPVGISGVGTGGDGAGGTAKDTAAATPTAAANKVVSLEWGLPRQKQLQEQQQQRQKQPRLVLTAQQVAQWEDLAAKHRAEVHHLDKSLEQIHRDMHTRQLAAWNADMSKLNLCLEALGKNGPAYRLMTYYTLNGSRQEKPHDH